MHGKKAISPLIMTIILIAVAVSLGTMIMNWGSNAVKMSPTCDSVRIEFQEYRDAKAVCYDANAKELRFILKNTGRSEIDSIIYRNVMPNLRVTEFILDNSKMGPSEVYSKSFEYNLGTKVQLEFIPSIVGGEGKELCSSKSLIINDLPFCED